MSRDRPDCWVTVWGVAAVDPVTVSGIAGDVEGLKVAGLAGVNTAVKWCGPGANIDVDPDAVPLVLTGTGAPMLVVPSMNCTVPTAVDGVMVAVSITGVPWATMEAGDVVSTVLVAVAALVAVPVLPVMPALFAVAA